MWTCISDIKIGQSKIHCEKTKLSWTKFLHMPSYFGFENKAPCGIDVTQRNGCFKVHVMFPQFYLAELPPVISWIGLRAARGGIGALCCFIGFFGKVIWSRFDSRVGTWVGRSLQDFTILLWNMLCALENWRSCQTIPIPIWLHGCWFPSSRHGRRSTKAFLQGLSAQRLQCLEAVRVLMYRVEQQKPC